MTETVRSLRQAQEFLTRAWPGNDVSPEAWRAYHQHAAEVYAHVAEVDSDHHHEALCWANQAAEQVRILTELIDSRAGVGGQP